MAMHALYPTWPEFLGPPTYIHNEWHTTTKFYTVIKFDDRKFLLSTLAKGYKVTQMPTRDLFAAA